MGKLLTSIIVYDENKNSKAIKEASLSIGKGIVGDRHYSSCANQISVLFVEDPNQQQDTEWVIGMKKNFDKGICHLKFKANLYITCNRHPDLKVGKEIYIGDSILTISKTKPCFEECRLNDTGEFCFLKRNACFAEVKKNGEIKIGNPVKTKIQHHPGISNLLGKVK